MYSKVLGNLVLNNGRWEKQINVGFVQRISWFVRGKLISPEWKTSTFRTWTPGHPTVRVSEAKDRRELAHHGVMPCLAGGLCTVIQ
jgi:hypothetical protein